MSNTIELSLSDSYIMLEQATGGTDEKERIEKVIRKICNSIASFRYDEAQTTAEDNLKHDFVSKQASSSSPSCWSSILNILALLPERERKFVMLDFIAKKNLQLPSIITSQFLQQAVFKPIVYAGMTMRVFCSDLEGDLSTLLGKCSMSGNGRVTDLIRDASLNLLKYIKIRQSIQEILLHHQDSSLPIKETYELSIEKLQRVRNDVSMMGQGAVAALQGLLRFEVECLIHLFTCYINVCEWEFVPSLLCLQSYDRESTDFAKILQEEEKRALANKKGRGSEYPDLHKWLHSVYEQLMSKYTLYFDKTLLTINRKIPKGSCMNIVDYRQKLSVFARNSSAKYISLILDTKSLPSKQFPGHGFKLPSEKSTPVGNLNSYQFIFNLNEAPDESMKADIITFYEKLDSKEEITFLNDKVKKHYFITRIDSHVFMALIYFMKKSESDVSKFMKELRHALRLEPLFQSRYPGRFVVNK